jgi:hypothetical protein
LTVSSELYGRGKKKKKKEKEKKKIQGSQKVIDVQLIP